jgi:hypothetical protein
MLPVRELAALAKTVDADSFAQQMGPFALMQRPAAPMRGPKRQWGLATVGLQASSVKRKDPAPIEFGDLMVATLPPPASDGTLEIVIGRSPECDVVIDDGTISARHASITWNGKNGTLTELGSANGTFLNGLKLGTHAPLKSGDQIAFGRSNFVYLLASELHTRLVRLP